LKDAGGKERISNIEQGMSNVKGVSFYCIAFGLMGFAPSHGMVPTAASRMMA
jgi:hypothetical protein